MIGLLVLIAVGGIVVATLALSGALDGKQAAATTAQPAAGPQQPPVTPPPPPSPAPTGGEPADGVLATVARTCGAGGRGGDCVVSVRAGPTSRSRERYKVPNGNPLRVVCQRHGERAYSSVLGASSDIWARTPRGDYAANVYLKGTGLDPFRITLRRC